MRVVVTGANGMLASAVREAWSALRPGDDIVGLSRSRVDLRDRQATRAAVSQVRPQAIVHCAAQVGGIHANIAHPTSFLLDNLLLDTSVISAAMDVGVDTLVYVGSSCMYPRDYRQPLVETDLLAAPLEPTNEGYAIAKIAGSKLCEYASKEFGYAYRTIVPSNLYGPKDDYDSGKSHLVAAAISKVHAATRDGVPSVEIWGDGRARREFTYVDDVAQWLVAEFDGVASWPSMMNVGCGSDHTVREYYEFAKEVVGYDGEFTTDPSKPAGMAQKLMDSTVARGFGWAPATPILEGMRRAYATFLSDDAAATHKES